MLHGSTIPRQTHIRILNGIAHTFFSRRLALYGVEGSAKAWETALQNNPLKPDEWVAHISPNRPFVLAYPLPTARLSAMAYRLHIERDPPISLDDWLDAIRGQASLNEDSSAATFVNPVTGERVSIPGKPGDVSVLVDGKRIKTFSLNRGRASFNAPAEISSADPMMAAAFHLAVSLSAVVRGDEGKSTRVRRRTKRQTRAHALR